MPDVSYDPEQRGYADAIARFCAAHSQAWTDPARRGELDPGTWTGLGELGVLGLTDPASGAGPLDVVAAHEALGRAGCGGPLWSTALLAGSLPEPERAQISAGTLVATVGDPARLPWAQQADLVFDGSELGAEGGRVWRCEDVQVVGHLVLLGHEPAARITFTRGADVAISPEASALAELALAAYLVGAARRVLTDVTAYVRTRRQFRRTLAQFQAVAHPLAECDARTSAAAGLVRRAASRHDQGGASMRLGSGLALASAARAARQATYQAHQSYGGIGFTEEGPLSWIGQRIAQLSTQAESLWRTRAITDLLPDGG